MTKRLFFSIGLLSASIIAFQLILMHILSIMQWNHFAYMIISVALLGFGASGTLLALKSKWLVERIRVMLPLLMILCGLSMSSILAVSEWLFGTFDSYLIFVDTDQLYSLVLTYLAFFIPFFIGALAIGLIYVAYVKKIGSLYFADLFGSGIGGLASLLLFWTFFPSQLPAVIAVFPVIAGILLIPAEKKRVFTIISLASLVLPAILYFNPPELKLSEYKSISKALDLPDAQIVKERTSPYGHIQVVSSGALRYAPGLSMRFKGEVPVRDVIYSNGDWFGPVVSWSREDTTHFLDYTTNALPFVINKPEKVMVADAGTGLFVAHSIVRGASSVAAVEQNRVAVDLLKNELAADIDSLFSHDAVRLEKLQSRSYLLSDTSSYDLIILPTIETFGGTSGIHALNEQYLLTREAFKDMWERLTDRGMIAITTWMDYPARNTLKVLGTLMSTLHEADVDDPGRHLIAVRGWGTVTFVLKKTPVTEEQIEKVREFSSSKFFDPLFLPGIKKEERARYNMLQDDNFFELADRIFSGPEEAEKLYSEYDFNIRPSTDNRPYFSQFLKWSRLSHLAEMFGTGSVPFIEVGYLVVGITFVQITVAAIVLIILPLFFMGWRGGYRAFTVLHFSGLGLGFMFVEIVLIQRFVLYFGSPIYAAAAVLSAMLICSGAGSYFSSRIEGTHRDIVKMTGIVIIFILLYGIFLTPVLLSTITLPFLLKILFSIALIAPLAFFMGMPFPLGLRTLSVHNNTLVPWAWGINGCLSVISTALALIIAVEAGFFWVMVMAALAYGITLLANYAKR